MNPAFNNHALQRKFERNGYLLFPDLLDTGDLIRLNSLYEKYKLQFEGPFHTSHFSNDSTYKLEVNDLVSQVVFGKVKTYLNDYVPIFGNFMVKNPNPDVAMDLHADWTYVDETKYTSVSVWIPLVDVNADNGCLGIIGGSQNVTNLIRGPLIRQSTRDHEHEWEASFGKLLNFKAGDAIIYNHRLMHYSKPNKSGVARPAINLSLVPKSADWIHYCIPEGKEEIQVHQVKNSRFYIDYDYMQSPDERSLIKTLPASTVKYMDDTMKRFRFIKYGHLIKNAFG